MDYDLHQTRFDPCNIIQKLSRLGEVILDTWCRDGSICAAARQMGRRCFGFEIDPTKAAVARARVNELEHIATGGRKRSEIPRL